MDSRQPKQKEMGDKKKYMLIFNLTEEMIVNRVESKRTYVPNPEICG